MDKGLRVILAITLTLALSAGLVMSGCSVESLPDEPNGGNPNGETPNGDGPTEPDLTGLGSIIDCDEFTGQDFKPSDPAPDFRFHDAAGQTFSLSNFRGKLVMLNFWTTWCHYCKVEFPNIQQVYDEWQGGEVVILTINLGESPDTVAAFIEAEGISLPVLLDREREAAAQYRVSSIPRTFFIDKDGLIQFIKFGAFSGIEEIESILSQIE